MVDWNDHKVSVDTVISYVRTVKKSITQPVTVADNYEWWAAKMNITTFFFEAFDEDWKGDPNNTMGAEKHWGLFTVDRKPKKVMQ